MRPACFGSVALLKKLGESLYAVHVFDVVIRSLFDETYSGHGALMFEPRTCLPRHGVPKARTSPESKRSSGLSCVSANWRPQYGHYFSAA